MASGKPRRMVDKLTECYESDQMEMIFGTKLMIEPDYSLGQTVILDQIVAFG